MKINHLCLFIFCFVVVAAVGCKKKINPELSENIPTNDYCGKLSGYDSMDIRSLFVVSVSASVIDILLDTNFLYIPNIRILTPNVSLPIQQNGNFDGYVNISLTDTSGTVHDEIPTVLSGTFSDGILALEARLVVNGKDYHLIFNGSREDYASLIDGKYYGVYAFGDNASSNDSIIVDWRSKKVVSLIANTKIENTPIVTDEETTVSKQAGYLMLNAITKMDVSIPPLPVFEDVNTEIIGKIHGDVFNLEVIFTIEGFPSMAMTFVGKR